MLKCWIVCIAMMLGVEGGLSAQNYDARAQQYIKQYRELAMAEQRRSGIPAAITLAQGIHETSGGQSELMLNANNHFGIKCKKNWTGDTYTYTDDAPDECFRKYTTAEASYRDHSDYLATTPRYASLFKLSKTDYAAWAIGLRQAGYATNPKYAKILIGLIEDYHLQEYTYAALDDNGLKTEPIAQASPPDISKVPAVEETTKAMHVAEVIPEHDAPVTTPPVASATPQVTTENRSGHIRVNDAPSKTEETAPVPEMPAQAGVPPAYGSVVRINGLKAVYAKKGDMPLEYAISQDIRYERLLEINEIGDRPLPSDMYLYLERKRFKGLSATHVVRAGETIAKIAQYESMQQRYLRSFNHLEEGEEPAEGAVLNLQQEADNKPLLASAASATAVKEVVAVQEIQMQPVEAAPIASQPVALTDTAPTEKQAVMAATTDAQTVVTDDTNAQEPRPQFAAHADTVPEQQIVSTAEVKTEIGPSKPEIVNTPAPAVTDNVATDPAGTLLPPPPSAEPVAEAKPAVNNAVVTENINPPVDVISKTPAKKEGKNDQLPKEDEPMDELAQLKARFDKVVYAPHSTEPVQAEPVKEAEQLTPVKQETEVAAPVASASRMHTVKKGDTAFNIARKYNMTVKELMSWNKLDMDGIKIGQKLHVK